MNYRSSYRRLLGNGKAALLAAIEIYNKPRISYRDECFVILLLNAWELIAKAVLSKNGLSIFYPKLRKQPYRTYSLTHALNKALPYIPEKLVREAVSRNLELLSIYRDNAVHFYNAPNFGSVIYALAQTSIVNLKDLLKEVFSLDLSNDITWHLLPLGLDAPIDPIEYISGKNTAVRQSTAVKQFLTQIAESTHVLEEKGLDTGRLLTVFAVKLESTKKIANADVVVGVQGGANSTSGPLLVTKSVDPNTTHPLKMTQLVDAIGELHGNKFTSGAFQAVAWKYGIKSSPSMCWKSSGNELTRYSNDTVAFIKRLTPGDVELAKSEYKDRNRRKTVVPATATLPLVMDTGGTAS